MTSNSEQTSPISLNKLFAFFLPLAGTALLVTISHVIINSTLARSAQPEIVIASYAIALSFFAVLERPLVVLRQTCSALVKDLSSMKAMFKTSALVIGTSLFLSAIVAYTPLGYWSFSHLFGVAEQQMDDTMSVFRVLMWVIVFSGVRCMFHGIIISNFKTKWMTIGMVIRLIGMGLVSMYYISNGVESGVVGAVIFLVGMVIECIISVIEGMRLRRTLPMTKEGHSVKHTSHIFSFYRPLAYASLFSVTIGPLINAMLGQTYNSTLAIAAYSVALTVGTLIVSMSSYTHQIVLNFYGKHPREVIRFVKLVNFIPAIVLGLLSFSNAGPWLLNSVIGAQGELLRASLWSLRVLIVFALLFPWIDYANGLLMHKGHTKVMTYSQAGNVLFVAITLSIFVYLKPEWNVVIGSTALSLGSLAELGIVTYFLKREGSTPSHVYKSSAKNVV
jgi:Na+-driven multidrug efflux pump